MTTDEKGTAMRVPPSRDDDTPSERTPEPARVHRQMPNSLAPTACPCASCVAEAGVSAWSAWWMIVCDECGNKRCPHGTDHRSGNNLAASTVEAQVLRWPEFARAALATGEGQ